MDSPRNAPAPYISVVIAARNDNHGGNMLGRMQACVDSWIWQAERLGLDSELIVVDWNPPAERPRLIESLRWPAGGSPVSARFIEAPPAIHQSFPNPLAIPLQQMIAKNVGIRRARGEYVLATNLDIVFSAELMEFLAARRLQPRAMYRMDRHDIASNIPNYSEAGELLDFAKSNILRVFAKEGGFELTPAGRRKPGDNDVAAGANIHFGGGWYPAESDGSQYFRWMEGESELYLPARPPGARTLFLDLEPGPSAAGDAVELRFCDRSGALLASASIDRRVSLALHVPEDAGPAALVIQASCANAPLGKDVRLLALRAFAAGWELPEQGDSPVRRWWRRLRSGKKPPAPGGWAAGVVSQRVGAEWTRSMQAPSPDARRIQRAACLHTNACGDFTLLSRDAWFELRGYAEFPIWPTHVDSLLCYSAYHAGIREVVLEEPLRIFHIEHQSGAGWTPEGDDELNARIARKGVTLLPHSHFVEWVDRMRRFDAPMIFTGPNWGLADVELEETTARP